MSHDSVAGASAGGHGSVAPPSRALLILSRLPLRVLHALAPCLAFLAFRVIRYRRRVVYENLSKAFPDLAPAALHDLVKAFYRNAADVVAETISAYSISKDTLNERVRITNIEVLERFVQANQSIVLLGTHEANWEWVFLACSSRLPFAIDAVYKPLHNPGVNAFLVAVRSRFGAVLMTPGDALRELVKGCNRLRAVSLIVDQRPVSKDECHWIPFLNQQTPFLVGFEKLARLWGYPVVLAARRRTKRGYYEVTFEILGEPPYDSKSFHLTERYAASLERSIRASPADWLWTHRRWRTRKPFYD